jgi:predicted metal-binding protein
MKRLETYRKMVMEKGADDAVVVETSKVVTAAWVRMKCKFGCAGYGNGLCCPPFSPTPEETRSVLDSYRIALLLHRHAEKGRKPVADISSVAIELERILFLDGYYKAWTMGAGPCRRCEQCDVSGTCRNPDKARPSMEACGIDVYATAHAQGLPIEVVKNRGDAMDLYALVLVE